MVALMEGIALVEEVSKLGLGMASLVEEAPDDAWGVLAEGLVDDVAQGGPGGSDGEVQQLGDLFVGFPASHARTARFAGLIHGDTEADRRSMGLTADGFEAISAPNAMQTIVDK